jgi:CBS domain-containing protein
MKRWLYAERAVAGDPQQLDELLRTRLHTLIQRATDSPDTPPAVDGARRVRLAATVAGVETAKTVNMTAGVATRSGDRLRIPVCWQAKPGRHVFPTFDGVLELQPVSASAAQLALVGSYQPPAGVIGAAADAILLKDVAQHSVDHLVEAIAQQLEQAIQQPPAPILVTPVYAPLLVRDVMTPDPIVFDENLTVRTAALLLLHYEISGAPVVTEDDELIGVVSETDLVDKEALPRYGLSLSSEAIDASRRHSAVTVGEICTRPALVTAPDVTLHAAAKYIQDHDTTRLVVIDEARVAGIITRHDVLRALVRTDQVLQQAVRALLTDECEHGVHARWNGAR